MKFSFFLHDSCMTPELTPTFTSVLDSDSYFAVLNSGLYAALTTPVFGCAVVDMVTMEGQEVRSAAHCFRHGQRRGLAGGSLQDCRVGAPEGTE